MQVERKQAISPLTEEWDALADRLGAPPWLYSRWLGTWWRAFGRGRLEVLAARHDGRLAGVVAVSSRLGKVESLANWHSPTFGMVAEGDAPRRALVEALLDLAGRSITIRPLAAEGHDVAAIELVARSRGWRTHVRGHMRSPSIHLAPSLDEQLAGARPGRKVVKELRRTRRRLEAEGSLELAADSDADRLEETFRIEASGWRSERGTAIASRPQTRGFYEEVARWAAARGWLRLFFLNLGGRPIACEFALEHRGVLYDLKGGYLAELARYGPGKLMLLELISWACARGLHSIELLGGDEPYKLQWTDRVHELVVAQAFAPTLAGSLDRLAWTRGREAGARLLRR